MSKYFCPGSYCDIIADKNLIRSNRVNQNGTIYHSPSLDIYPPNFSILARCCGNIGSPDMPNQIFLHTRSGEYTSKKCLTDIYLLFIRTGQHLVADPMYKICECCPDYAHYEV